MNENNEKKYKQLALFSVIVVEVVFTPSLVGGVIYWLLKGQKLQLPLTFLGAILGLVIAFYRIYKLVQLQNKTDSK